MNSSSDPIIKWDAKFSLGIPYIDKQHMHLVELCGNLYSEILKYKADTKEGWQQALVGTLKECASYVKTHFSDEEKLMICSNYSDYSAHKVRHDEFTKKVLEIVQNFNSISYSDAIKFCKFLYDWILSHIAHEDKLYVPAIIEYQKNNKR